jgi:acyl-CoA thioesterase
MTDTELEARALAEATAQAMFLRGGASRMLGIRVAGVSPGNAILKMQVRADVINAHDICHGGFIFALADSALAFAAHSYNVRTVTSGSSIDYRAPAVLGDTLTAVAMEQSRNGKTGVYDVSITKSDGSRIAIFSGKSHQIQREVIPPLADGIAHTIYFVEAGQ